MTPEQLRAIVVAILTVGDRIEVAILNIPAASHFTRRDSAEKVEEEASKIIHDTTDSVRAGILGRSDRQ